MAKVKRSAKKNKVKKVEAVMAEEKSEVVESVNTESKKKININKNKLVKYLLVIAGIVAVLYGVYKYKGLLIAASVNGIPVSRVEVISELEKQGGKSVLDVIITKKLLDGEAKKKNISVSQKELEDKYTEADEQFKQGGQSLDSYLQTRNISKQDFLETQIRYEILINKLLEDKIKIDSKEVENYIEQNKDTYKDRNMDEVKKEVEQMMKQQKLSMETGAYLEELKKNAKIDYFTYVK